MKKIEEMLRRHMNTLCLEIGSKHCGSPELCRAEEYIAGEFSKLGYQVMRESFPVRGWNYTSFLLENVTRGELVPAACPCYFSNSVDICDSPLWITHEDIARLEELPVKNRLCFITYWYDTGDGQVFGYNGIAERLDRLGAAAAIFLNRPPHTQLAPSTKIQRSPFLKTLAAAAIAEDGAIYMANYKNDVYHLKIEAFPFDTTSNNVIARIGNGSKKAVIGAHYDTAPLIEGAQDNVAGVSVMLEIARLVRADLEKLSREWTIDFVAFSAEEYVPERFCPGSYNYTVRHKDDNIKFMLNIDDPAPYFSYRELALHGAHKLPPIKYPYATRGCTTSDDVGPFHAIGVPTVWIATRKIYCELHTANDNLSHSDFESMQRVTLDYIDILKQYTESDFWDKKSHAPNLTVVPAEKSHYEEMADIAVIAWRKIYDAYKAQLGEELFTAFFSEREAAKRRSVIYEAENYESLVALDSERVVAFINYRVDGKIGEICTNAILPEYAGFGIGTRLQSIVLEKMKNAGATHAFVITGGDDGHIGARRSYEKNGFEKFLPSVKYFKEL